MRDVSISMFEGVNETSLSALPGELRAAAAAGIVCADEDSTNPA